MNQQLRSHLRLIIFTGVAVGLAIVFLLSNRSAQAPSAVPDQVDNQSVQPEPEPEPEPEPPFAFPAGAQELIPSHRLVALYGTPGTPALGSLGEQSLEPALERIKKLAAQYQEFSDEKIYPTFEIITTVAAAEATDNGDYSREISIDKLKPWVDGAKEAGVYVVLDLQPGLTDFLTQAKLYEELLKQPHVGLALDPEWRLKPGQRHMKQVGTVSAAEINQTAEWLADLTKQHELPQKLMLIHQFKLSMISNRTKLDTSRPELAWLIQMDGLGNQNVKQDTWRNVTRDAPDKMFFGWKNFIDEDKPMLTPKQTMTTVKPAPWYVSYQ